MGENSMDVDELFKKNEEKAPILSRKKTFLFNLKSSC